MNFLVNVKKTFKNYKVQVDDKNSINLLKPVECMTPAEIITELGNYKSEFTTRELQENSRDYELIKSLLTKDYKYNIKMDFLRYITYAKYGEINRSFQRKFIKNFIHLYTDSEIITILNENNTHMHDTKCDIVRNSINRLPEDILEKYFEYLNKNKDFKYMVAMLENMSLDTKINVLNKINDEDFQKRLVDEILNKVDFEESKELYRRVFLYDYDDIEKFYEEKIKEAKDKDEVLKVLNSMKSISTNLAKKIENKIGKKNPQEVIEYFNNNDIDVATIIYFTRTFNLEVNKMIFSKLNSLEDKRKMLQNFNFALTKEEIIELFTKNKLLQKDIIDGINSKVFFKKGTNKVFTKEDLNILIQNLKDNNYVYEILKINLNEFSIDEIYNYIIKVDSEHLKGKIEMSKIISQFSKEQQKRFLSKVPEYLKQNNIDIKLSRQDYVDVIKKCNNIDVIKEIVKVQRDKLELEDLLKIMINIKSDKDKFEFFEEVNYNMQSFNEMNFKQYSKVIESIASIELQRKLFEKLVNNYKTDKIENKFSSKYIITKVTEIFNKADIITKCFCVQYALIINTKKDKSKTGTDEIVKDDTVVRDMIKQIAVIAEKDFIKIYDKLKNDDAKYNFRKLLPYLIDDNKWNLFLKLNRKNENVLNTLNVEIFEDDVFSKINFSDLEILTRYGNEIGSTKIEQLSDSEILNAYISCLQILKSNFKYSPEKYIKLLESMSSKNHIALVKSIIQKTDCDKKTLEKLIFILKNDIDDYYNNIDKFNEYMNFEREKLYNVVHKKNQTHNRILNCFMKRFFNIEYYKAVNLLEKYGKNSEELLNYYYQKEELSKEELKELKCLELLENMRTIINITEDEKIIKIYDKLDKNKNFQDVDFMIYEIIEENIIKAYNRNYMECLFVPDRETYIGSIKYKNRKIKVYSPIEFNMLVYTINNSNKLKLLEKNCKRMWNKAIVQSDNSFKTCFSSNKNLCTLNYDEKNKNVVLGFSNLEIGQIRKISPFSINSKVKSFNFKITSKDDFYIKDNFILNYRGHHNELTLEKNVSTKNGVESIQPSYVVCYNRIDENSKKVAIDFGIPIVLINIKKVAKNELNKLNNIFNNYMKTKQLDYLRKYIESYQNNITGLRINFSSVAKKYFGPKKMQKNMDSIINDLYNQFFKSYNIVNNIEQLKNALLNEKSKYEYSLSEEYLYKNNIDINRNLYYISELEKCTNYKSDDDSVIALEDDVANA